MGKFANENVNTGTVIFPAYTTASNDGFNAFGKPVPMHRRSAAYAHAKDMGCIEVYGHEKVFGCIEAMSNRIARDDPHGAMEYALAHKDNPNGIVDATGVYRLLAVLLTG